MLKLPRPEGDSLSTPLGAGARPSLALGASAITLMICNLGRRLQSARVRWSPSRNFLLEMVMSSTLSWSISSGRGVFR